MILSDISTGTAACSTNIIMAGNHAIQIVCISSMMVNTAITKYIAKHRRKNIWDKHCNFFNKSIGRGNINDVMQGWQGRGHATGSDGLWTKSGPPNEQQCNLIRIIRARTLLKTSTWKHVWNLMEEIYIKGIITQQRLGLTSMPTPKSKQLSQVRTAEREGSHSSRIPLIARGWSS